MIAQLSGSVLQIGPTSVVVEVGGLGILALCSPNTVAGLRIGQRTTLATSLIVREDSLTLYGFSDDDERQLFELLQTANGVGRHRGHPPGDRGDHRAATPVQRGSVVVRTGAPMPPTIAALRSRSWAGPRQA